MAKKINALLEAKLVKNQTQGGAWLCEVTIKYDGEFYPVNTIMSAWGNPSAGKRWIKEQVLAYTNKKSIKMIANEERDVKDKPANFAGTVAFKVEA